MFSAMGGFMYSGGDPYWSSVSLLENFENPQNSYVDSSTNNFPITSTGNTFPSLNTPFNTTSGSISFSGSSAYSTIPNNSAFVFNGDFTVECWVYTRAASGDRTLYAYWPGISASYCSFVFRILTTSRPSFVYGIGGLNVTCDGTSTTISANTWTHIAATRSGTTLRLFVNGVQDASTFTVSGTFNSPPSQYPLGIATSQAGNSPTSFLNGCLSNIRIVKGTALYTSSFTPSTTPLTAVAGTVLLINGTNQGAYNNTLYFDQSKNGFIPTATGIVQYNGLSPFNNSTPGSYYFLSTSSSYLTVATNAAFTYGTSDFTIECWVYFNSVGSTQYIIDQRNSGTATAVIPTLYVNSSNNLIYYINGSIVITGSTSLVAGQWYHVAVSRSSSSTKMFLNGTQEGSTYSDSNNYAASRVVLGSQGDTAGNYLNGYLSNVRLSKGYAYYTSTFTPSGPLTVDISYTSLLLSGMAGATYDVSPGNQTITSTTTKFVPSTQQYKFGTQSGNFTTTGYLQILDKANNQFGTGDFTIEGWIYRSSSGVTDSIMGKGTGTTGWLLQINSSNQLTWTSTSSVLKTSTTTIPATTWTYFAITRSGTTAYMFINGTLEGSTFTDNTNYNQSVAMIIGADRSSGNGMTGYLDDLRITKGVCRYTSSFTSPSSPFPTNGI